MSGQFVTERAVRLGHGPLGGCECPDPGAARGRAGWGLGSLSCCLVYQSAALRTGGSWSEVIFDIPSAQSRSTTLNASPLFLLFASFSPFLY